MASNARILAGSFHRLRHLFKPSPSCNVSRNKNQLSFNDITYFKMNILELVKYIYINEYKYIYIYIYLFIFIFIYMK